MEEFKEGEIKELSIINTDKRPTVEIIEYARELSKETDKSSCIYDAQQIHFFNPPRPLMTKSEIRNHKIESILNTDFFIIDSSEIILDYPSITTYYDTETDSSDILTRHQRVTEFLESIWFTPSQFIDEEEDALNNIELHTIYETHFVSKSLKNISIRISPNLLTKIIIYSYEPNKEITFFFNKSEIIRIIEKEAPVEWKRDIKIKSILKN
jgi:hypothetical protein